MNRHFNIYILIALCIFTSCGTKKNITANVESTPAEAEINETVTNADTLPEFLREFANDSTIHINWVYGIPFIIDDSVPMYLPPIDKNLEGYVSSDAYCTLENGNGQNRYPNIDVCGISNPIDSIAWLNKCINNISDFIKSPHIVVSHLYTYTLYLYMLSNGTNVFVYHVSQMPRWEYVTGQIIAEQASIYYAYDCDGNLLGKSFAGEPVKWKNGVQIGKTNLALPNGEKVLFMLKQKGKLYILIRQGFNK